MFECKKDLEELQKAQCGVVDVIITKQVTFRTKAYVCFDLDKRETFVMPRGEPVERLFCKGRLPRRR